MIESWAQATADRIVGDGPPPRGKLLFLGAADTGKTTLAYALAARLARAGPVALVDADVGRVRCLTLGDVHIDIPSDWS